MREHQIIKRHTRRLFFSACMLLVLIPAGKLVSAQDLEDLLNQKLQQQEVINYAEGTFKGTRVVNGHSCEITERGDLMFLVSHRFGRVNSGFQAQVL